MGVLSVDVAATDLGHPEPDLSVLVFTNGYGLGFRASQSHGRVVFTDFRASA